MHGSLSWIEWLDRLDRVLAGARQDIAALARASSPRTFAAIEGSRRQLSALIHDLRLLDRDVLPVDPAAPHGDLTNDLQCALDTALFHLGDVMEWQSIRTPAARERVLAAIDAALVDTRYEAAILLEPRRRRA